jgi:threonine dehydrogenase-like Zn-dependent dehydrogenase
MPLAVGHITTVGRAAVCWEVLPFPGRAAGDVRIEDVADPVLKESTDALVRVTTACICGSDLHPYRSMSASDGPVRMGHEFIGVVEEIGSEARSGQPGDLVVVPFAWSDGTYEFCRAGLQTSCLHGGFWAREGVDGGQGEAARVPLADGALFKLPVAADDALIPSLLTLSDVFGTGHTPLSEAACPPAGRSP